MAFAMDQILSHLGKPGRYQLIVCFFLCCNYFQVAFNHLAMAFFGSSPLGYYCGETPSLNSSSPFVNITPVETCRVEDEKSWCKINANCTSCGYDTYFKMEDREWTINAQFGLACGEKYRSSLASSIYFLGVMFGGVFFGYLADAFGRFPILIAATYLPLAAGVGLFFSQSYVAFVLLRFVMGFLIQGLQIVNVSLIMEYFSPKLRGVAACVLELFWGIGGFMLALIAFLIRDWRWMQLCFSLLILLTVFYIWLIPESLRWLLTKKKFKRAEKLVARIARFNGLGQVPPEVDAIFKTHQNSDEETVAFGFLDLFKHRTTLLRSIVLWYIWFAVSLGYYGLILNTGVLYGFKYTTFLIGAGVEIPAYIMAIFILFYFGRRRPLLAYFLSGGIACIVSGVITNREWKTALALVGRFGMAGAFSVMFLYTSELYPTVIRNVGLGSCIFWTRVGGLLAPQINLLGSLENSYKPLPIILFGILSIIAGFLALILPETLHQKLPDTMEESGELGWGCGKRKSSYKLPEMPMENMEGHEIGLLNG